VLFASQCSSCHRLGKTGADIGPDLTLIRKKFDRSTLLDAIINPSAAIAFGYEPWLITGKDGSTTYGFLLADGTTLVVKDPSGQRHVLEAAQVASRKQFNTSLMPTPAALGLNEQDLADVTEYLMTLTETGKDER
jgi:putative heme-binding domain-containing protein